MKLKDKLKKLESILKGYDSILVALSGGVDSAFLLVFSTLSLGKDKVSAITACGRTWLQTKRNMRHDSADSWEFTMSR